MLEFLSNLPEEHGGDGCISAVARRDWPAFEVCLALTDEGRAVKNPSEAASAFTFTLARNLPAEMTLQEAGMDRESVLWLRWRRWRTHYRIVRLAVRRVMLFDSIEAAAVDSDLNFCIAHHRDQLSAMVGRALTRSISEDALPGRA